MHAVARWLADAMAAAMMERHPGLDPQPLLPKLQGQIILSHGRADRLIPWTETLRLRSMMPHAADVSTTKRLLEAGKLLGIDVLDHVIIGDAKWISLKQQGLM